MKISIIENIELELMNLKIEKLSPSNFSHLIDGCKYQFILNKIIQKNPQYKIPLPPKTIMGTIIHRIIELRYSGEIKTEQDFESKWNSLIEEKEIENYGEKDTGLLLDWTKFYKAKEAVLSIPVITIDKKKEKTTEVGIWDIEYIHGAIDKINIKENEIELIDFKSGNLFEEDGTVKYVYKIQLKLYALLYQLKYRKRVTKLFLVSFDNEKISIDFTQKELEKLYQQVKDMIGLLNVKDKESLVNKDPSSCNHCFTRHLCQYYWQGEISETDISGILTSINEYNLINIEPNIKVSHLPCYSAEELQEIINSNVRILNLSHPQKLVYGNLFRGKRWSRVYIVK